MRKAFAILAVIAALAGCNTTSSKGISESPAPPLEIKSAARAVAVCARHAPDWAAAEAEFLKRGFAETRNLRLVAAGERNGSVFLQDNSSGVLVQLGSARGEGACLVGLPSLTPDQSYRLALPWVKQYDLATNAERGQGLSSRAVQAWGRMDSDQAIYVAAYKTWDALEAPGAAVRLLIAAR